MQRDITTTAELVRKGHGFAVLQIKRAIGVHRLRAAARYAGRKYRAAGGLQGIAFRRVIVRDIRLLYREAHRFVCHGLGGKNKIAEVNRTLVVIANADFCEFGQVKVRVLWHFVQLQLDRDPLVVLHHNAAAEHGVQIGLLAVSQIAAHLVVLVVLQGQIQVVGGQNAVTVPAHGVNVKGQIVAVFDVERFFQRHSTVAQVAVCAAFIISLGVPFYGLTSVCSACVGRIIVLFHGCTVSITAASGESAADCHGVGGAVGDCFWAVMRSQVLQGKGKELLILE